MVEKLLLECVDEIRSVGIFCFGLNATVNLVSIAQFINAKEVLMRLCDLIHCQLFRVSPDFFFDVLQLYPSYISKLIDIIPEVFVDGFAERLHGFYFEREYQYVSVEYLLCVISILRKFHRLSNQYQYYEKACNNIGSAIERIARKSDVLQNIDYQKLTLAQINDLLWYANITGLSRVSKEINALLSKV